MIDAAKVLAASGGDFARVKRHLIEKAPLDASKFLPIIAVPTTSGTGSEVTSWATVWDSAGNAKYSLANPRLYPEAAFVDPALTLAAPRGLTMTTGLDALSHSLESLWNVNANPVSANYAVEAAREIIDALPRLLDRLNDLDLRTKLARASLFAGLAFSNTKTALAHNISYGITLRHGTPHGIACSFCLPQVMEWAIGADPACDESLQRIFGGDLRQGVQKLTRFMHSVGVGTQPSDHGVGRDEWDDLVERASRRRAGAKLHRSHHCHAGVKTQQSLHTREVDMGYSRRKFLQADGWRRGRVGARTRPRFTRNRSSVSASFRRKIRARCSRRARNCSKCSRRISA